jgi:acyl carrier protein
MDKEFERLSRCFSAVFPRLSAENISAADVENLEEWDSLASVTLAAVMEEEFGIVIDPLDISELNSFSAVQQYLASHSKK